MLGLVESKSTFGNSPSSSLIKVPTVGTFLFSSRTGRTMYQMQHCQCRFEIETMSRLIGRRAWLNSESWWKSMNQSAVSESGMRGERSILPKLSRDHLHACIADLPRTQAYREVRERWDLADASTNINNAVMSRQMKCEQDAKSDETLHNHIPAGDDAFHPAGVAAGRLSSASAFEGEGERM